MMAERFCVGASTFSLCLHSLSVWVTVCFLLWALSDLSRLQHPSSPAQEQAGENSKWIVSEAEIWRLPSYTKIKAKIWNKLCQIIIAGGLLTRFRSS